MNAGRRATSLRDRGRAEQRGGGHDDVGAGEEVLGDIVRILDSGRGGERGVQPPVKKGDPACGAGGPPPGWRGRSPAPHASDSGSMSGCMKRLNSTRASAPASSSGVTISPVELKYGLSFTATGMVTALFTRSRISTWRLFDLAAGDFGSPGR